MYRRNSPFDNDTSSYAESVQSTGYATMDEDSSQVSGLSRPSAKSIYKQRREYASSINTIMDKFQYRVEHLLTSDLDGKELKNVADCVEQLKLLDGTGRLWGQSMLLEVKGPRLLLTDIETKEELDSIYLSDVVELKAMLDSGVFDSLLTVAVKQDRKHTTSVFIFQCEDARADYVQRDLSRALSRSNDAGPRTAAKSPEPRVQRPPVDSWLAPDYEEDDISDSELFVPDEDEQSPPPLYHPQSFVEVEKDVEILNHILNDIEVFTELLSSEAAKAKKKKKKGKVDTLPAAQFAVCLQKFKTGFNLLGELNGNINNPSAPDLVHSLFTSLAFVVSFCPETLPPTIQEPQLTLQSIRLMNGEVSAEEDQLWQSLGDAWNVPSCDFGNIHSTKWPKDEGVIQTNRSQSPRMFAPVEPRASIRRQESAQPAPNQNSPRWGSPQPLTKQMRVMYDFVSRNNRELTVNKGETVELLDMTRQWWKVRNSRGEEGYVPNNILEDPDEQHFQQPEGPPVLTRRSKPPEVKAWLEYKGFSKITVRCLSVLSGSMLLGMSREEIKAVCPEEGGRVFYQLRAVKTALAAAS